MIRYDRKRILKSIFIYLPLFSLSRISLHTLLLLLCENNNKGKKKREENHFFSIIFVS